MSKKPGKRQPHHPAHPAPVDPDEVEQEIEEELEEEGIETMADEPKTAEGEPKHPDPKGKMRSHAPGYTTGPQGESVELPADKTEEKPKEE